jgi:hypothetical protein
MMKKLWIEKFIARGGIFLIVPLLALFGTAPVDRSSSSAGGGNPLLISSTNLFLGAPLAVEAWCNDSDAGQDGFEAGFVEGVGPNGFPFKKYDTCDGEDTLKEFYCNGTTPWPVRIDCELGCLDGACLTTCTDGDGDGYSPQGGSCGEIDCDDTDPLVNPGAGEVCGDGVDNNCNGLTDGEDPTCVVCTDSDGDGFAVEGRLCGPIDCDDTNAFVNPGALEACSNGIDDDCDGAIDDDDSQCLGTNTIVIGWDGTQRDHFWECFNGEILECSGGLPNVQAIFGESIFDIVVTSGETSTKPGWSQIFSGYNADTLGIYSNGMYQPIPEGFTVFEKLEQHFGPANVVTMFISGKNVNTGAACVGEDTTKAGQPVVEQQGQPWCNARETLDYYENDLRWNEVVGNRVLELLETHQNDLIVAAFIFREPDVIGHVAGENSPDYSNSLVELDMWLGLIVDKLIELGIYENTNVYLTSDHGYDEGGFRHGNGPYLFLATTDPAIVRGGDRMDIGATLLTSYGVSLEANALTPAVQGYPLTEFPTWTCVAEGDPFYDYAGAPACCTGLTVINFDYPLGQSCIPATGGTGDNSGFCTACGDGVCTSPENSCNCPVDCP